MKIIDIKNLNKKYKNNKVIEDLNVAFENGRSYMIIGENGSGKTTLIKCILGLTKYSGSIEKKYQKVGYVPEKIILPTFLTVYKFLFLLGSIRKMEKNKLNDVINKKLYEWKLYEKKDFMINTLSKGNIQKVLIIQALLHDPEIIILDEVLNGLDVSMQKFLFSLLDKMKKEKKTIILTSHYPWQYKGIIDIVYEIKEGKIYVSQMPF